ncbi:hypothetical protein [Nocardioides jensenii]|uniref:hypothetical protein n=1 Tax=Nocardioides jensenii TaxID=1843 RepID=UPI00082AC066|nr:hypothetical protein [Nocardioides jensenii]
MRRLSGLVLVMLLAVTACSNEESSADRPSPEEAGTALVEQMTQLRAEVTDGVKPVRAWQVSIDGSSDLALGCDDGARRRYLASVELPWSADDDSWTGRLVGMLAKLGWEAVTSAPDDPDGAGRARLVTAERDDDAGTHLDVYVQQNGSVRQTLDGKPFRAPVVHLIVSAHTDCLTG